MAEYQYRMFMNAQGEIEWIRKQLCSSTTLTSDITADAVVIPVDDVTDLFGGDLSGLVTRTYNKRYEIQETSITVSGDGETQTLVLPAYWRFNDITATVDGDPEPFEITGDRLTFEFPPPQASAVEVSVNLTGITYPTLASSPEVTLNGTVLTVDDDYTLTNDGNGTRVELPAPLALNDEIVATVNYLSSGATTAWINNEQIVYYGVDLDNNLLLQCQRGMSVTAARDHSTGTRVWDGSDRQRLLEVAKNPSSGFSEADVRAPRWNQAVLDFLAEECSAP